MAIQNKWVDAGCHDPEYDEAPELQEVSDWEKLEDQVKPRRRGRGFGEIINQKVDQLNRDHYNEQ